MTSTWFRTLSTLTNHLNGALLQAVTSAFISLIRSQWMCFVTVAMDIVLNVRMRLMFHLIAIIEESSFRKSKRMRAPLTQQSSGKKSTLSLVLSVKLTFRKIQDACTWLALSVDMSFAGYVWETTETTAKRLASDCVTRTKMLQRLEELINLRWLRWSDWIERWEDLLILRPDTANISKLYSLTKLVETRLEVK